jgi:hypothetical protein
VRETLIGEGRDLPTWAEVMEEENIPNSGIIFAQRGRIPVEVSILPSLRSRNRNPVKLAINRLDGANCPRCDNDVDILVFEMMGTDGGPDILWCPECGKIWFSGDTATLQQ